jgi:hypothetical protein
LSRVLTSGVLPRLPTNCTLFLTVFMILLILKFG